MDKIERDEDGNRLCPFCGNEIDEYSWCHKCKELVACNEWEEDENGEV